MKNTFLTESPLTADPGPQELEETVKGSVPCCTTQHAVQCLKQPHCLMSSHAEFISGPPASSSNMTVKKRIKPKAIRSLYALPPFKQLGHSDPYWYGLTSIWENGHAVPSSPGYCQLFWLEIHESF